ncbi:MAG: hybrid sensor histidine kinase/response regulator [Bacteroidales bacterium]
MEYLKILIVDDEPGIRSGVLRILKSHRVSYPFMDEDYEFRLLEAASGEEALKLIDNEMPDIVLLDNKLPGIQGIDVLEYIKEKNYDIVVAMITSYASLEVAVKATGFGASDFIPKPFTPQELKSSIDHITKQLFLRRITSSLKKEGKKIRFQFLSVLSHELKAPLNAIEGYLKMMQDKQAGNDIASYEKMIERSLSRIQGMRNLIMDLLDFTKIRFEKRREQLKPVDLCELARMSISTVQPYAIQKNVHIFLHCEGCLFIEADPEDMEIVFNNLISNAVKYNFEEGRVDISIRDLAQEVELEVKDTGFGISEEELPKLFREFVRIKNERTKNIAGSGLGLSIVKKVTELYDGSVQVTSGPEGGSTFIVRIPKQQAENTKLKDES